MTEKTQPHDLRMAKKYYRRGCRQRERGFDGLAQDTIELAKRHYMECITND